MIVLTTDREIAQEVLRVIDAELDSIAQTFIKLGGGADRKLSKRRAALQKSRGQYVRVLEV